MFVPVDNFLSFDFYKRIHDNGLGLFYQFQLEQYFFKKKNNVTERNESSIHLGVGKVLDLRKSSSVAMGLTVYKMGNSSIRDKCWLLLQCSWNKTCSTLPNHDTHMILI